MMLMKGKIICFEGIDGAGKKTQSALLMKHLRKKGINAKVYSYPDYSSKYGKIIHRYLTGKFKLGRKEHFVLFLVDIAKDIKSIRDDLKTDKTVIMDRYFYTALAYICPSGLDYAEAKRFADSMGFEQPSAVFYLDIPTRLTSERKSAKKGGLDKFERNQKFLGDVKKVYEKMRKEKYGCNRWIMIDASKNITAVHRGVLKALGQ